jgi:hypothetical protein
MVALKRTKQAVSCVLLLEGTLPMELLAIKNALGVQVIELDCPQSFEYGGCCIRGCVSIG